MKHIRLVVLVLLFTLPIFAQTEAGRFFYVDKVGDQLVYFDGEEERTLTNAEYPYTPIAWHPSHDFFMMLGPSTTNDANRTIWIHDFGTPEAWPLVTEYNIDVTSPIHFGEDAIYFTVFTPELIISEDEQGLGVVRFNVYAWDFLAGLESVRLVGGIPYGVGCGGSGIRSAIDLVYSEEVGGDTSYEYNRRVLAPTRHGIVHNNGCTAIRTMLTQPDTLESVELGHNLRWVTVSPDGGWVAGAQGNDLALVNLSTLETAIIATADAPIISTMWHDDDLYFATRTTAGDRIDLADPDGVLDSYDPDMTVQNPRPEDALQWQSTIYRYDTDTGQSEAIYVTEAYAIGHMTVNGDLLIFSQIETPTAWLQASVDNPPNLDTSLIDVTIWQIKDGEPTQLADDLRGILVQPG